MSDDKFDNIAELEEKLAYIIKGANAPQEKLARLENALWTVNNSGYCDAMANKLMAGIEDNETHAWNMNCINKYDIGALYNLLKGEIE